MVVVSSHYARSPRTRRANLLHSHWSRRSVSHVFCERSALPQANGGAIALQESTANINNCKFDGSAAVGSRTTSQAHSHSACVYNEDARVTIHTSLSSLRVLPVARIMRLGFARLLAPAFGGPLSRPSSRSGRLQTVRQLEVCYASRSSVGLVVVVSSQYARNPSTRGYVRDSRESRFTHRRPRSESCPSRA